jgi:hypothetical protein
LKELKNLENLSLDDETLTFQGLVALRATPRLAKVNLSSIRAPPAISSDSGERTQGSISESRSAPPTRPLAGMSWKSGESAGKG